MGDEHPMPKRSSKVGVEARRAPLDVKRLVLHEAGYKCSNPACRYPLTLDVHHLYYVSDGGSNQADNLLPLCPNCHTEHHNGNIPTESLRAWKMLLLALNEAFDRKAIDLLLAVAKLTTVEWITGDGVEGYAALVSSNLVTLHSDQFPYQTSRSCVLERTVYAASLTDKGKLFVEAWKKGDQRAAIELSALEKGRKRGRKRGHH